MTLFTEIVIVEPVPYRAVHDLVSRAVGAPEGFEPVLIGPQTLDNQPGQGFAGWVSTTFALDGPLAATGPVPPHSVLIDIDTAYGFSHGAACCDDLHGFFVELVAGWAAVHGATIWWHNEYWDRWFQGPVGLLGSEAGRAACWAAFGPLATDDPRRPVDGPTAPSPPT